MTESETVEFRASFEDDLNRDVVAFANTLGGKIYVGIDDDGSIRGVEDIKNLELRCADHVANTVMPDITMFVRYEETAMDGKAVLKITVNKGSMTPYYLAGKGMRPEGVYVRRGTASVPATDTAIVRMIRETSGKTYEETRSLNQNLTFIEAEHEFSDAGIAFGPEQKRTLGITGRDGCYTNLGLLLSEQCVHTIKFAVYEGARKQIFRYRHEFSGSLFRQYRDLTDIIDGYNRLSSPEIRGLRRIDERDYPEEAIREAVLNAVIHRDYGLGGYTLVSMFSDRMEIVSLGGLVRGVEMRDIMMGVSFPRNARLAEIFYRLHLIEAYGTGIGKIKDSYRGCARQPAFECSPNAFKVLLPKNDPADRAGGREDAVIETIRTKGEITRTDVEDRLNISQAAAIRLLGRMVDKGRIARTGSARGTKYRLCRE